MKELRLRDRNEFEDDERDRREEGNDEESCREHKDIDPENLNGIAHAGTRHTAAEGEAQGRGRQEEPEAEGSDRDDADFVS